MAANGRLTVAVRAFSWMGAHGDSGAESTMSAQIARDMKTNPVAIRPLMSELGDARVIATREGNIHYSVRIHAGRRENIGADPSDARSLGGPHAPSHPGLGQ